MNKKGFTLVELIAVVAVIALIIILVTPNILKSADRSRMKAFESKVTVLEAAAAVYGQDNYRNIINGVNANKSGYSKQGEYYTYTIEIRELVPEYISKDIDEGINIGGKMYYVQDPRDTSKYLDDYTMTIRIHESTRKVTAKFNES